MRSLNHIARIVVGVALCSVSACQFPMFATPHAATSQQQTTDARSPDSSPDQIHDIRLFGQGAIAQDLSFEGKAAVNVQQHTTASEGADFDPAIDPDAHRIVFSSTRHSRFSHLYVKSIDGSTLTQITDEKSNDAHPVFSPDAKRIAFASDRAGQWDIWVVDANGRNAMQLTTSPLAELHPSWSPDGKKIVYCRLNPKDSAGELWIADLDNPSAKRLIGEGLFPAWSPKGDKIAFQRARQRGSRWFSIWTITLENGEPTPPTEVISNSQTAYICPTWSADGSQLAFACVVPSAANETHMPQTHATNQGRADIAMIDANGRGMVLLTNGRGENYSPSWSSDDRIFFASKLEGSETIWSVKPFRPSVTPSVPAVAPMNRHAAQISEDDSEP